MNAAADLCEDSCALGTSALEKFLDTGKTLCDIFRIGRSNAAGMECSHGKLCTRLTDRLSSDSTYRLADCNRAVVSKVYAVALSAYTDL